MTFRNEFGATIFQQKYAHQGAETWEELAGALVENVVQHRLPKDTKEALTQLIIDEKFLPGGRYLANANRPADARFFNNCFLLKAEEDTREDWGDLSKRVELCLTSGGGIGVDYSVYREKGAPLGRTGGVASGPVSKMIMINDIGRAIRQGGDRRSAIYGSLSAEHPDAETLLYVKDWDKIEIAGTGKSLADVKELDFNFPAPLDGTNISLNYGDKWLDHYNRTGDVGSIFKQNVRQAMKSSEPGFSFNFGAKSLETLRNACCEITSSDDSDVCNLGSLNMSRFDDIEDFREAVELATAFLLCGTMSSAVPYDKVEKTRGKNRRLGLGLMGVHEWLISRGARYEMTDELHAWMRIYEATSDSTAKQLANRFSVNEPAGKRAIAPTGSIGILAGTTTGIEPLFSVAYKRRWLGPDDTWQYQYVVDSAAQSVIDMYGVEPEKIESALDLAADPERRVKFQYEMQKYVDHAISSTINLPAWGSDLNNDDTVDDYAALIAKYAHGLRGLTFYADGSRGGQPLTSVPYREASNQQGITFVETHDMCDISGGGTCGS
jgi:ribonucleoside-diphosphate reductase alpha chain